MDNTILKQLLTEYDSKRMHALEELENRKKFLRSQIDINKSNWANWANKPDVPDRHINC